MDLISVIVPIYKAEKYLNRCIAAIAAQTYHEIEIILVDDGSPDECPMICDEWAKKDKRVKVIHQQNSGVSMARNAGMDFSSGHYIIQVDSDDYISPNMIELLHEALVKNSSDMSICGYVKGNEDNYSFEKKKDYEIEIIEGTTALERIYKNAESALQYVVPWAKLYRRDLFDDIRYPKGKIFEDIYVTHQILFRCDKIAVIPQKLTYYYQHPDSIMNKKYHVGKLDYLDACKNRISFFDEHGLRYLAEIAYAEYLHSLIWEYSRARDLLADKSVMKSIINRYREVYKKGYSSIRYPSETKRYLAVFNLSPELIVLYWKITAKLKR